MVTGRDLEPGMVAAETRVLKEKILSPEVTSPLVPLSKNCWVAEPPMALRSAVTEMPVLTGFVPGVTVTVSSVDAPASRLLGDAAPTPEGGVVAGFTVSEMVAAPVRDW